MSPQWKLKTKRFNLILLILLLSAIACNIGFSKMVQGSENIITQPFDISGFTQVELGTIGTIHIQQGDVESLTIETDDNILPLLEVSVEDSKLTLTAIDGVNLKPSRSIMFLVTVTELSAVIANSSGNFFVEPITGECLEVFIKGSGDVTLEDVEVRELSITSLGSGMVVANTLEAEDVQIQSHASGSVEIAGNTNGLNLEADGSGEVLVGDLQASNAVVILQGSGDSVIWVVDSLDITISGSGDLLYYGKPDLTMQGSESGKPTSLGEK